MKKWLLDKTLAMVMILMAISSVSFAQTARDDFGLFLETEVNKSSVIVGEPVIATLWLYVPQNVELNQVRSLGNASYGSCDTRVATDTRDARFDGQEERRGQVFNRVMITQVVLYPTESGAFQIRFPDIQAGVVTGREYDPFWGMPTRVRTVPVSFTNNVHKDKIKVKDISKDKPSGFSNAIGSFSFEASLPPGDIVKGNDVSLIYTIEGVGSLEDFQFPDLAKLMPAGVDVKSVKPSEKCYIKDNQIHSEIVYTVTLVPHILGEVSIPPVSVTCYDVNQKRFRTLSTSSVSFDVQEPKVKEKPAQPVFI